MITAPEFARAMNGAALLARGDRRGLDYFDNTVEAFWRSFYAAMIVAPGYAVLIALRLSALSVDSGPGRIFAVESIGYVTGWVAFPLIMVSVATGMGRWHLYLRYIAAYNWAVVLQMLLLLFAASLATAGALGAGAAALLGLGATIAILLYQWFIAREALQIGGGAASAIVLLDFVIAVMINTVTAQMIRLGPPAA